VTVLGKSSRHGQKWRHRNESVCDNLRQYGLSQFFVDVLVADSSLRQVWRQRPLFDAIIADRELIVTYLLTAISSTLEARST